MGTRLPRPQRPGLPRPLGGDVGQGVGERTRSWALGLPPPAHRSPERGPGQMMKHSAFPGPFYRVYDCFNLIVEIFFFNQNSEKTQGQSHKQSCSPTKAASDMSALWELVIIPFPDDSKGESSRIYSPRGPRGAARADLRPPPAPFFNSGSRKRNLIIIFIVGLLAGGHSCNFLFSLHTTQIPEPRPQPLLYREGDSRSRNLLSQ